MHGTLRKTHNLPSLLYNYLAKYKQYDLSQPFFSARAEKLYLSLLFFRPKGEICKLNKQAELAAGSRLAALDRGGGLKNI